MGKIRLRAWVALLTSVVLLGSSIHVTNAEEVVDTYATDEDETGTEGNTDITLTSLKLGDTDKNGDGWDYVANTHTLSIEKDVTVAGGTDKIISSDGDLIIVVANGATLTVKNSKTESNPCGIYAGGNLVLNGAGTINVETASGQYVYGIYADKSITISNIHLSVKCVTNAQVIRADGGSLVIDNAYVTATGTCSTGEKGLYLISILGESIVNIKSTTYNGTSYYGLRGNEYTFSNQAHVKISSKQRVIGDKDGNLTLTQDSATDYYWRTENTDSGWKNTSCSNSSGEYLQLDYFEYIGSAHAPSEFVSNGDNTHRKACLCTTDPTTITMNCSGGEATCTKRAICSVCEGEYGDPASDHEFVDHVCEKCGTVEAGVAATVTAENKTHGFFTADDAITYAIDNRGSAFKLLSGLSANSITINDSKANFTVDLNGQTISNGWSVTDGTVTITDSSKNSLGWIYSVTVKDKGTVSLESGNVSNIVDVEGGVFNIDGGTIATIHFKGGQVNWHSATAIVTSEIRYNDKNDNVMVMNAKPGKPLNIVLDDRRDLEKPFATVKNGSIPNEYISTIRLVTDGTSYKYSLQPAIENNQLFARFPLNQNEVDITLDTTSDLVYNGSAREPGVTIKRCKSKPSADAAKYEWGDVIELTKGTDYTVSYADNTNAGTAKVTIKGIGCYTGSVERTFTIGKATWKTDPVNVDMGNRTYSCHKDNTDQVDLNAYLPKDSGTVTATVTTSGALGYIGTPTLTKDGMLSFTTKQSSVAQSGTIKVTVSTTNYEDFTITVPVETKNLGIVCLKDGSGVALVNDTLTEGEKLSKLTFKDVVFVDENDKNTEVPGTLSWQTPDAVPALGTTSAQWVFQPKAADSYAPLSGSVAITVQKKSDAGSGGASSGGGSIGGGGGGGAAAVDPKTDDPKQDDTKTDDKTDDTKQNDKTPASKGTKLKTSSGVTYQVTSDSAKAPKVTYRAAQKKAKGTVTVPKTVTIKGVRYQVTAIAAGAFSGCKNVKHIVIPSSITAIGKNAFADCAKLKTITINTTKLNSRNVADGAFDNIADGTVIRVPKRMLAKYQKLFGKKGLSDKVKLVAIKAKKK